MIKGIIIDDEVHCIDTLSILLADYCPEVEVMDKCMSVKKGLEAIEIIKPDLVFLDIEMPVMNGFALLEQFKQIPFSVIFTTSYDQDAITAICSSALDYLLKPIDPKELINAVYKVQSQKAPSSPEQFRMLIEKIRAKEDGLDKIAAILNQNIAPKCPSPHQHRLAAILFTDIVAYTATMQHNETEALTIIKRFSGVLKQCVKDHEGEVLNAYRDGSLRIFSSAAQAVQCSLEVQQQLQKDPVIPLRIGLHIGEISFQDGKIVGDGLNVASRIQSIASGNSIFFSEEIQDKIKNIPKFRSVALGPFNFKNVENPIIVFALANKGLIIPNPNIMEGKLKKKKAFRRWIDFLFSCS